ncbi:isochorismate synthase [Micromonospora andamanensis]|uniref:isochorismate synthase n=1 Tax=Micromonospora andamanensis TaxID=1287068 RepID=UPI001950C30D|nr:isochorismate synthase [Micromonospora andamanensis]GIJ42515.1 isochorismate synthase DhbC [Micromonospora andamanensis]
MTAEAVDTSSPDVSDPTAVVDDCELFLASPTATLVARDVIAQDNTMPLAEAARRGTALLTESAWDLTARERACGGPLLVGAAPFDPGAPTRLTVARDIHWGPPLVRANYAAATAVPRAVRVDLVPWPARYMAGVERAVARIAGLSQHKVVLSRAIDVITAEPTRVRDVVRSLLSGEPDAYVFAVPVGTVRAGARRVLVGASPELVIRRIGRSVLSNPLAGSAPRSADPVEDRRRAWKLQHSPKDLLEHRIVVDAVTQALRPFCAALDVPDRPSVIRTSRMWHLSTKVRGVLADPLPNALELAAALHPTPAVCGWPTAVARQVIAESETFDRQYYTGLTGWMNESGDGEWVLALRCAELADTQLRLYAGAGVVSGSDPASELAETTAKFHTFLAAIGLEDAVATTSSAEVVRR